MTNRLQPKPSDKMDRYWRGDKDTSLALNVAVDTKSHSEFSKKVLNLISAFRDIRRKILS